MSYDRSSDGPHHPVRPARASWPVRQRVRRCGLPAALLWYAGVAAGADFSIGPITVTDPWAATSPPMAPTGAAYMLLRNDGGPDALLDAASPVADTVELHLSSHRDGIMKMERQDRVELPGGAEVRFQPGGLHVMFIGLHDRFEDGDSFPLTLTFEHAGQVEVTVAVRPRDGGHGGHGGHGRSGDNP